jgi:hypothetical protein
MSDDTVAAGYLLIKTHGRVHLDILDALVHPAS